MLDALMLIVASCDAGTIIYGALRYWRISVGLFAAAAATVAIALLADSPAVRWIVGFHIFVIILTAGIIWEQKQGKLGQDDLS